MKILKKNKNMIRGIHYFSTELKRKLMSSQGAALKQVSVLALSNYGILHHLDLLNTIIDFVAELIKHEIY